MTHPASKNRVFIWGFDFYGNPIIEPEHKRTSNLRNPRSKWNFQEDYTEFLLEDPPTGSADDINPSCVAEFLTCMKLNMDDLTCKCAPVTMSHASPAAAYHPYPFQQYYDPYAAAAAATRHAYSADLNTAYYADSNAQHDYPNGQHAMYYQQGGRQHHYA